MKVLAAPSGRVSSSTPLMKDWMKLSAAAAQTGSLPLLPTSSDFSMKARRAAEVGVEESEAAARAALVQAGSRLGWTEN